MHRSQIDKTTDFFILLQTSNRITVRRLEEETGLHRATIYRYLSAIGDRLPIKLENGVVTMQKSS